RPMHERLLHLERSLTRSHRAAPRPLAPRVRTHPRVWMWSLGGPGRARADALRHRSWPLARPSSPAQIASSDPPVYPGPRAGRRSALGSRLPGLRRAYLTWSRIAMGPSVMAGILALQSTA